MKEKIKEILLHEYCEGKEFTFTNGLLSSNEVKSGKVACQICQLFPKSRENPEGHAIPKRRAEFRTAYADELGDEPNKPDADVDRIWQPEPDKDKLSSELKEMNKYYSTHFQPSYPKPDPNCPKCGGAGEYFICLPDRVNSPQLRECDCVKPESGLLHTVEDFAPYKSVHKESYGDVTVTEVDYDLVGIAKAQRDLTASICAKPALRLLTKEELLEMGYDRNFEDKLEIAKAQLAIDDAECQKRVNRMFARTLDIDTQTLQKVYDAHEKEIEAVGTHILKIIDREEHINSDTIRELRLFGQSLTAKYQKPPKLTR